MSNKKLSCATAAEGLGWNTAKGSSIQNESASVIFSSAPGRSDSLEVVQRHCHWGWYSPGPTRGAASLFPRLPLSPGVVIFLAFNWLLTTHGLTYITSQIIWAFFPKPDSLTLSCSFVQPHTRQISDRLFLHRSQMLSQF